ncbi:hypothetical protein [Jannaschia aquimarina]|uniref:Uncharacterized protein n=1 Tax=Jannaschia aquimarina TaxID=935700 RepID=A0A0D1CR25_9RHOB|nr:hypothetical protein [Jannaschia aquimarina]KIT17227.1 hypothetical protein jaqu_09580 [Jannaschia aquimarina]SNT18758.1 hypothetical protein SAMN05421775_10784 [Jannaschia aquimarina]
MADEAMLREKLERLEAALNTMEGALDRPAPVDRSAELEAAKADLEAAQARIAELEGAQASSAPTTGGDVDRMRTSLEALAQANEQLRAQTDGSVDASLRAELDALKAAREMDLSEMRALLAELEPMLESA